jgi:hypothetical protein
MKKKAKIRASHILGPKKLHLFPIACLALSGLAGRQAFKKKIKKSKQVGHIIFFFLKNTQQKNIYTIKFTNIRTQTPKISLHNTNFLQKWPQLPSK